MYAANPANAKAELIKAVEAYISENEMGGVSQQGNAIAAMDTLEVLQGLNLAQAYKMAKAIDAVEAYDPASDKWGFGPRKVSPVDFSGFEL